MTTARTYASMTALIDTKLQSTGTALFSVAEVAYQIEESLKEYSTYQPHIVPMIFKIESRTGTDVTGTANKLTDSVKAQFVTADGTNELVIHNVTDNTWAVATARDSASVLSLNADIMDANEEYELFNKQCTNRRQIYLGDMPQDYNVHSVEYPIGQRRNFVILDKVLEINVDYVDDSNSTLANLGNVDVLVRFTKPHVLCQMTDTVGKVAATTAAGATTLAMSSLAAATIEVGEEFTIQYHRSVYVVAAQTTVASSTCTVAFYPSLEAAAASTVWVTNFRVSSLRPQDEDLFADLCVARLSINKAPRYFNVTVTGGGDVPGKYFDWGERRLAETLGKLRRMTPPHSKQRYPSEFVQIRRIKQ